MLKFTIPVEKQFAHKNRAEMDSEVYFSVVTGPRQKHLLYVSKSLYDVPSGSDLRV